MTSLVMSSLILTRRVLGARARRIVLHIGRAEFKYANAPRRTKSMTAVLKDLGLELLWVVYPGRQIYKLDKKITACPLEKISEQIRG